MWPLVVTHKKIKNMNNYIFRIDSNEGTKKNILSDYEVQAETIEEANAKCEAHMQYLRAKNANIVGISSRLIKAHLITNTKRINKTKTLPTGFSAGELELMENL